MGHMRNLITRVCGHTDAAKYAIQNKKLYPIWVNKYSSLLLRFYLDFKSSYENKMYQKSSFCFKLL